MEKSNIQSKFIRGLRVSDNSIINIVESVLIDFNNDIVKHLNETGSLIAKKILDNFEEEIHDFYQVCPKEMLGKLEYPITKKPMIKDVS